MYLDRLIGGSHHYQMASLLVSAPEKEVSEALNDQDNP